jgi:glycosyltransferase involved in cell wall biosynthesis
MWFESFAPRRPSSPVTPSMGKKQVEENVRCKTRIELIPLGVQFPPQGESQREPIVLTIGQIRRVNLVRKGVEVFTRAAALVPDARFLMVGQVMDDSVMYLRSFAPPNLEIRDHVSQEELDRLYSTASVYVQASAHESFALTVVEAMAAGDIPVVSRRATRRRTGVFLRPAASGTSGTHTWTRRRP